MLPSFFDWVNPLNLFGPIASISSTSRKRKASSEIRHPSSLKLRRLPHALPRYTKQDYEEVDFYEGEPREAAERKASFPTLHPVGTTYVIGSDTESDEPEWGSTMFPSRKVITAQKGSPISPESLSKIRAKRLKHLKQTLHSAGEEAKAIGLPEADIVAEAAGVLEDQVDGVRRVTEYETQRESQGLSPILEVEEDISSPSDESIRTTLRHLRNLPGPKDGSGSRVEPPSPPPQAATQSTSKPCSRRNSQKVEENWNDRPNERAMDLAERYFPNLDLAATQIKKELEEPEYALRDIEIRDGLWQVMDKMERIAKKFFDFEFHDKAALTEAFGKMDPETVKVIGCVASGGPGGQEGWRELFYDGQKRRALVCAIIGNVLVEQVFQHLLFGADDDGVNHVKRLQRAFQNSDGFTRNFKYADQILHNVLDGKMGSPIQLPINFSDHVKHVILAIYTHLKPILSLSPSFTSPRILLEDLYPIVATTGILSILMRLDPHTVYYFTPTFKEEKFQRKYMEIFNRKKMEEEHPHQRDWSKTSLSEQEIELRKKDDPITQIAIMNGVTAYRMGGWETANSSIWKPVYHPEMKEKGVRSRILTHGWVYCRWGRARKFEKGKEADRKEEHGNAWRNPGFVEFRDVDGVPSEKTTNVWKKSSRTKKLKRRS